MRLIKHTGFTLFFLLWAFVTVHASNNCDASFTYQSQGNGNYIFVGNQQRQSGYTYFDTWVIGNTIVSNNASFTRNLGISGLYNICHTISIQDSTGTIICKDSTCVPLQVTITTNCMPFFSIMYSDTNIYTYRFSSTIFNYTNLKIVWDFGDGRNITGVASPMHVYNTYGNYVVKLYATDTLQHCTDSTWQNVYLDSVYECQLYANFADTQLAFNSSATILAVVDDGVYQIAAWSFGDGTSAGSKHVIHQFPAIGSYNVCLTLTDTLHGCTSNICNIIYLDTCSADMADIQISINGTFVSADPFTLNDDNIVPTYFNWNFGDGSSESTSLYTNHYYNSLGVHQICFTAQVPGCAFIDTCQNISVGCGTAVAYFLTTEINSLNEEFTALVDTGYQYKWTFGDGGTGINNYPQHVYAQPGYYNVCLYAYDALTGCRDTFCHVVESTQWTDTICGNAFVDLNLNGIQDSTDLPLTNASIRIYGFPGSTLQIITDSTGHYSMVVPQNLALTMTLNFSGTLSYTLPFGGYYLGYSHTFTAPNSRQCGFDFGITTTSATVRGIVYADLNHDSIMNVNDRVIPNQTVAVGNQWVISNSNGDFYAIAPVGITNLNANFTGDYTGYLVYPPQRLLNITTPGSNNSGNNFGIELNSNGRDVAINLFPTSPIGLNSLFSPPTYQLLVSNLTDSTAYYQANIVSDSALTFNPVVNAGFTLNNTTTRTTSWIDNLYGFSQKLYTAIYDLSGNAFINEDIYNSASIGLQIGNDNNVSNDTDICHQVVVSSFDPNNKTSNQAGIGPQGYITNNQVLDYVIDFQNTGTSAAQNIIVRDIISPNLDINTFKNLASSSTTGDVRITGDTVYFRFSHINLPCAQVSETGSLGWVAFSIKPKPNLPQLTQITNNAAIFFDHNAPVITNTTLHTIGGPEAVTNIYNDGQLTIAPNPFSTQTVVELKNVADKTYQYTVSDILGRVITSGEIKANTPLLLERRNMGTGTYIIAFYNGANIIDRAKIVAY